MNEVYIGIDVSKNTLDVASFPASKSWQFENHATGINQLVSMLRKQSPALTVAEATGGYETEMAYALKKAGIRCAVVNPREVRDFARATKKLAKTDRLDAYVLAHFAALIQPEPRPLPDEDARELEAILSRRRQVVEMITSEKNRLHHAMSPVKEDILAHIAYLEQRLQDQEFALEGRIDESPVQREKYNLLKTVPGAGPNLARTLLIGLPELGDLDRREVAAVVGVAPYNRDSGKRRGIRHIRGGRPDVRSALYMSTLVATRYNPVIREYYLRLCSSGKAKKVALVACMSKLLTILNAMVRNHSPWAVSRPELAFSVA